MPKLASSTQFNDDESVLRFEDSEEFSAYQNKSEASAQTYANSTDEHPYGSLKTKQEELLRLRHELEKKEREATELEARRQREERFNTGRREMCERLARTLARLERELYNTQKAIEEITVARASFERHLAVLRAPQPETWQINNMNAELDHALAAIEDAEDEYAKTMRRLGSVLPHEGSASHAGAPGSFFTSTSFLSCVRQGFAFTLPLAAIIIFSILLVKFLFYKSP